MTRRCVIEGCNSKSGSPQHRGVTFHSFPFDSKTREIWIVNCRIEPDKNITKSVLVCSRHFRRADFQPLKANKYLLKQGSVPTIFPWGKLEYEEPKGDSPSQTEVFSEIDNPSGESTTSDSIGNVSQTLVQSEDSQVTVKRGADEYPILSEPTTKMPKLNQSQSLISTPTSSQQDNPMRLGLSGFPTAAVSRKSESVSGFVPGVRLEAQDFDGMWHSARIVEVDNDEREVLIRFEKSGKGKGSSGAEEWIPMNSSRLRQKSPVASSKSPSVFVLGEKCLARWSGSRRFPATVLKVLGNDTYEILFDDGYKKVVKGAHISKMKPTTEKQTTLTPKTPTSTPKSKATPSKKDWPLISMSSLNLDELNLPEIPKDGEWCCHWVNDQPIGREGFLTVGDHRKPTVIVEDWRLPPGWTKHMYQRSNVLGKWDVILINSNGKRFRSKADLKQFIEDLGQTYNPDVYDFSIHRRRAKDIGAYVFTKDYKAPVPQTPESRLQSPQATPTVVPPPLPETPVAPPIVSEILPAKLSEEECTLEDGYVYVGSLKVQIIDNLFRCPHEGCNKNFRKENHLQIHIKHYHDDIAKLLGVCPNMQELACKRTIGHPAEEPLPKNHLPNAQFFAKLHQQDLQTKMHRKSLSAPLTPTVSTPPPVTGLESPLLSAAVDNSKMLETVEVSSPVPPPSATSPIVGNIIATPPKTFIHSTGDMLPAEETKSNTQPKIRKAESSNRKSSRQRLQKKYVGTSSSALFDTSFQLNDFEETRHSFNGTPENKTSKKAKLIHPTFIADSNLDGNSHTTSSFPEHSQSPQYINENGEIIKIVRMRQEEIINCLCSFGEEDGLMIQCELCLCWQHGICNGIEKESQVPEKYVCYICRNPQRGRSSLKYIHDQDWLYEGKLPVANYHQQNPKIQERFEILRKSHTLTGNLLELKRFLHSLKVKINIAENKDHPKMYLWAKKWESSPVKEHKIEKAETDLEQQEQEKKAAAQMAVDIKPHDEGATVDTVEKMEIDSDHKENKPKLEDIPVSNDGQPGEQSKSPLKQQISFNQPTIPQPEAAIDPVECQHRLLEHIQKQQSCVMDRLENIESLIAELETVDDCSDMDPDDYTKTAQSLSILIKDLEIMKNIAKINTVQPSYVQYT